MEPMLKATFKQPADVSLTYASLVSGIMAAILNEDNVSEEAVSTRYLEVFLPDLRHDVQKVIYDYGLWLMGSRTFASKLDNIYTFYRTTIDNGWSLVGLRHASPFQRLSLERVPLDAMLSYLAHDNMRHVKRWQKHTKIENVQRGGLIARARSLEDRTIRFYVNL